MAGRSSLNVMVIALLSVLVLVLIFLLVLQNQALEESTQAKSAMVDKLKTAQKQRRAALDETQKLRKVITGSVDPVDHSELQRYLTEARAFLLRQRSESPPEGDVEVNFQDLVRDYEHSLTVLQEKADKASRQIATVTMEAKQREEAHKAAIDAKTKEVSNLEAEISKLRNQVDELTGQLADKEAQYTQQLADKEDEVTRLSLQSERQIRLLKEQVAQREMTITQLKMRLAPLRDVTNAEPAGAIVKVANRYSAYIDLGRNAFIRPGLVFEVYEQAGKKRKRKGMIEVNRVFDNFSQVTITEEDSELNPIVPGDRIWSPFYKKGRAPNIVFAGEKLNTSFLSKDFLIKKLTERGAKVTDKVDASTDYVIALKGYQEDANYNTARLHGVMILKEEDILPYVLP